MSKLIISILLLAGLAGAGYFAWVNKFSPEAKAITQVKDGLLDPDSAKFKNIYVNAITRAVCGEVNSKNKMGGYAGFKEFIVLPDGSVRFDPEIPNNSDNASDVVAASFKKIEFLVAQKNNCESKK